jgi:hypothetical protein
MLWRTTANDSTSRESDENIGLPPTDDARNRKDKEKTKKSEQGEGSVRAILWGEKETLDEAGGGYILMDAGSRGIPQLASPSLMMKTLKDHQRVSK